MSSAADRYASEAVISDAADRALAEKRGKHTYDIEHGVLPEAEYS